MYIAKITPKTTPQEMFDEIKKGLEAGNFPAYDSSSRLCKYRYRSQNCSEGQDFDKCCLAGMFIDTYDSKMDEGGAIDALFYNRYLSKQDFPDFLFKEVEGVTLFRGLQMCHDNLFVTSPEWNDETFLNNVKRTFKLYGMEVN